MIVNHLLFNYNTRELATYSHFFIAKIFTKNLKTIKKHFTNL